MITNADIELFIKGNNYDLRQSKNGRWIDQKCAPDVVSFIADVICVYQSNTGNNSFSSRDIWHYDYAIENIDAIFKKPSAKSKDAENEYDKFFQQPLEMFTNAKLLTKSKRGNENIYTICREDIIYFIALKEKNALYFIKTYVEKVLMDSGIFIYFDNFLSKQTKESYKAMKEEYSKFIIQNTKINGVVECNRIFIKVLNPLAYYRNAKGTERGFISKDVITYDMLMYNRSNFRDVQREKPKQITRKKFDAVHPVEMNELYEHYKSLKTKRFLKNFNKEYRQAISELPDAIAVKNDLATNVHHIFPENEYPEISSYLENLIVITPSQHYNYAHPQFNTKYVDRHYQYLLLTAKVDRIEENLNGEYGDKIYDFANLLYVLSVGFNDNKILDIEHGDYNSVHKIIDAYYMSTNFTNI